MNQKDLISLKHPHGFWVILLDKSESEEWRFHFWPKGRRRMIGMPATIHTHDRVVESRIVLGELTNIIYTTTRTQHGGRPVYEVAYMGDKHLPETSNVLKNTNLRAKPVFRSKHILNVGNSYRVEAHAYHEAVVASDIATATVVCMHSHVPGRVEVLGCDSYPDEISFKRTSLPARELLQQIS